ncbi:MAG: metallophosphoesterase, partial [Ruminococcus sp.]
DLLLCGHTHDGQIFPGNLITKLSWENSCGYLKKGNMHNIVTSGVGVYGPYIRVGTHAEVVSIDVNFK